MDQDQNQPQATPKQQVIERVRSAANVLVTVRSNPSVDELASAIGLTLMLNKLGKHATAVFSGSVPSTLEFLKPEDTIETNTDSLRDFIVSLDKSKADKLRYKVEENVVKIFITPYRTSITQDDLEFTQGDFNVDVVLALGVTAREELDQAITAHGRILHDATVVTVTAGQRESSLGAINWQEAGASSLSEMLVSISEAFQGGIIDDQMATAFLTGIVAETERFSNPKTSPKVMTMAAQLMAAGANQQLIANELQKVEELAPDQPVDLPHEAAVSVADVSNDGTLSISHESSGDDKPEDQPSDQLPIGQPGPPKDDGGDSFLPPLPEAEAADNFEPLLSPDVHDHPESNEHNDPQPTDIFADTGPNHEENKAAGQDLNIDDNGNIIRPERPIQPKHKSVQPLEESAAEPAEPAEPNMEEQLASLSSMLKQSSQADSDAEISDVKQNDPGVAFPEPSTSVPEMDLPSLPQIDQPSPLTMPEPPAPAAPAPPPPPAPMFDMSPPPLPAAPLAPPHEAEIPDETTLLDIEKTVQSPHLGLTGSPSGDGVDNARDAVQAAISQADYNEDRPEPRNDLNAQPLGVGMPPVDPVASAPQPVLNGFDPSLTQPTDENQQDNNLPPAPPLPPPLMPVQ